MNIEFDETKEIEMIFDFHDAHILRVNTTNANVFLEAGKNFDLEVLKRLKGDGKCRIIYIVDKAPPLSAILTFVQFPFEVEWGEYAVIAPRDYSVISKFVPIVTYGLNLTGLKGKYELKVFNYENRNDLTNVFKWFEENESKPRKLQ